ncbi:hypothetical protein [Cellulomonas sp. ES6]|uniref:hypothetical protein n=1 Tax=Cellulomonas sp. ES6 TaxID=3039384 RepID=UPI0019B7D0BE|nr:hypothetical protein [Cellulomonas sp. ES6]MBD3781104.1 hypothetical protein [Micrococcales bacterium]WHP17579.1 hypothetical protein P9841_18795 [Cellulomonas sp. ES6]
MPHDDRRDDLPELTRAASDVFSAQRVFGEAYEHDGTLVIPVAKVLGSHGAGTASGHGRLGLRPGSRRWQRPGPGAGQDEDERRDPEGPGTGGGRAPSGRGGGDAEGSGFATRIKPLGVYVVDSTGVRWRPAVDVNRVVLGGQVVGAVSVVALSFVLAVGRLRRRR